MTTQPGQAAQDVGSPISNEAYNVLTALQSKLEGLEAYRKYAASTGTKAFWERLTELDTQAVDKLVNELERLVREDKFRMRAPGQTA